MLLIFSWVFCGWVGYLVFFSVVMVLVSVLGWFSLKCVCVVVRLMVGWLMLGMVVKVCLIWFVYEV